MVDSYRDVTGAGRGYTTVTTADGRTITARGNRSSRNNNPGNLEYGSFTRDRGALGSDGRFAVFSDRNAGFAAMQGLLFDGKNYKSLTLGEAIERYAPPHENNTKAYAKRVADQLGISVNTKLRDIPAAQRPALTQAMATVESLAPAKYYDEKGKLVGDIDPRRAVPIGDVQRAPLAPLNDVPQQRVATPTPAPARPTAMSDATAANVGDRIAAAFGNAFGVSPAAAAERSPGLAYAPSAPVSATTMPASGGLLTGLSLSAMSTPGTLTTGNERARGLLGSVAASQPSAVGRTSRVTAPTPMGPTQSFNTSQRMDAGNLGTPAVSVAGLVGGNPTHKMNSTSQPAAGIMGGAMPTSGGLLTDRSLAAMNAPAINGISGNERALGLYSGQQLLDADVKAQRAKTFGPAPAPAAPPATITTAAPNLGALPTAFNPALQNAPAYKAPAVAPSLTVTAPKTVRLAATPAPAPLPAPVTIAPAPKVASVPRTPVAAVTRNVPSSSMALGYASSPSLSTGLGPPSVPSAPAPTGLLGGLLGGNGAFSNRRNGALVGGLLGSAVAGPVGGLLGAVLGRAAGNSSYGTPSNAAQAALNAGWDGFGSMTSAQSAAARNAPAGGGSAGWGGGGGLLGGIGSFFGDLLGGGAGSTARVGSYGNSPNNSGYNGGVSANMGGGGKSSGKKK